MNYVNHNKIDLQRFYVSLLLFHKLNIIKITKEEFKKKFVKDITIFLKKKKKKSNNMLVSNINIYLKMKNKSLLKIEKNIVK